MRILLVEDEQRLAESLQKILEKNQYHVDLAFDGDDGLAYALSDAYDLIILDWMLPNISGIEILQQIRQNKLLTPVLLLTAKNLSSDKVSALDYGADDYMTKPFDQEELLARARALLRRASAQTDSDLLEFGDIVYSISCYELTCNDKSTRLTQKEGDLLAYLIQNKNSVINKEQMIVKVWGLDSNAMDNHVEVYISFLRKKLKIIDSRVKINTLRGIGYQIAMDTEE